ncbi:hypothetical protein [Sphingomonas nostoxanthinifaciens]|uniref:hypothetical protein n=1 Tax=Sphingomonas nostoxanthinifaciens TaxID=2872652 RepID=UPI001CC1F0ED|nr:hypothetical protein [Sphingomonas nostoxanthinifaciens]UAK25711.1 hypothetical protein K8P63_06140 [Sphingomonas nostoxanthinifaciens]
MTVARNLLALWGWPLESVKLGTAMMETMVGAQSVIFARLPVIGMALTDPLNADHRELGRMMTEKVSAFRTSGKSVGKAGGLAREAATSNAKAFHALVGGGLLWPADWMRLFEANLAAAAALATLPAIALAPLHQGVIANDRRLRGSNSARARSSRPTE